MILTASVPPGSGRAVAVAARVAEMGAVIDMAFKRGDRVSALVWDNRTTLTPGVVLGRDGERSDRVRVLVHLSTGPEVKTYGDGNREYLDIPLPETARWWESMYVDLEAKAAEFS